MSSNVSSTGLHSLATLIKRLEAAASRFEDLTVVLEGTANKTGDTPQGHKRGASTSYAPPAPPVPPPPPPPAAATAAPAPAPTAAPAPAVAAYQKDIIDAKLTPFIDLTRSFAGPNVIEAVSLVQKQYGLLFDLIKLASACQKPEQKKFESLLAPFPQAIEAISRAKESGRRDKDWLSHLTVLAEGAPAIGWVVQLTPKSFIVDMKDSVVYYGNRVKKDFKEKDSKHIQWVNQYVDILSAMETYVQQWHTTGLSWNAKGISVDTYQASVSSSPSAGGNTPPTPPAAYTAAPAATPAAGGVAAVFAELNRGEDVTKGLRKVDKSEMTHKNPSLRASSVVPASTSPAGTGKRPIKPSKPQALAGKKPSKFALEGNKWTIEYHENETLTLDDVEINQSVNIYGCKGTTVVIQGKVNAVNLINSSKTSVLVQSVVASIAVTASPSFQIQVLGTAPMIQLDSTDSGQIYLSKDSLNAEITTAKCSAININIPTGEEEGLFDEQPVPEMFKAVVRNGKLITTVVEHSG